MTAKQYIQQLLFLEKQIQFVNAQAQKWHDIAYGSSGQMNDNERVQTSVGDRMADAIAMYLTFEKKYRMFMEQYRTLYDIISEQLSEMSEPFYSDVLRRHLILEQTLYEISADCGYSYRQTKRKYSEALGEFDRRYGESYKDVPKCPHMSLDVTN